MSTQYILTPQEVHDVESFTLSMLNSGQWPLQGEYICDSVYANLERSHEALRELWLHSQKDNALLLAAAEASFRTGKDQLVADTRTVTQQDCESRYAALLEAAEAAEKALSVHVCRFHGPAICDKCELVRLLNNVIAQVHPPKPTGVGVAKDIK